MRPEIALLGETSSNIIISYGIEWSLEREQLLC
jgi:hypothetical protein